MIIVEFIRYTRGWVRFKAEGGFPERFLNLAAREAIPTWNTSRMPDGSLCTCTNASKYKKLRPLAKKTGVKLRIIERGGFPFFRNRYRRRTGILVGMAIFIAFILVMSNFIWKIEVSGNEKLDTADIVEQLKDLGVKEGSSRRGIDARDVERQMLLRLPELGWIAVNIEGGIANIRIHERTMPPERLDSKVPCNLVATDSGQIKKINVYDGQAMVKPGDTVVKGDILVSGIVGREGYDSRLAHSRADVLAEVPLTLKVDVNLNQTTMRVADIKKRYALSFFGIELPMYIATPVPKPYKLECIKNSINIMGIRLPIGIVSLKYFVGQTEEYRISQEQAMKRAEKLLENLEAASFSNWEVTSRVPTSEIKDDVAYLSCEYWVIKDLSLIHI